MAFRGKCSVNHVSLAPPCYWAQPFCPCPSSLALCPCPALAVQHCCLFSPVWAFHFLAPVSCPILIPMPSSHPLHFLPSLHCLCASRGSVGCTERAVYQLSGYSWCHSGIWLATEIITGKEMFSSCNRWNRLSEVWESSEILGAKGENYRSQ